MAAPLSGELDLDMVMAKMWYLHIQGESIGPMPAQAILAMLKQNRVEIFEFAWSEGLERWMRLSEISEFNSGLPPYPTASVPGGIEAVAQPLAQPRAQAPTPDPKPETKVSLSEKALEKSPERAPPAQVWPKVRRAVRIPIHGKVDAGAQGSFEVLNFSEGGVFVHAEPPLATGSELRFKLTLDGTDSTFEMTGVVIRQGQGEGQMGFAIEFTRLNPAYKRIFLEMIAKFQSNQQK